MSNYYSGETIIKATVKSITFILLLPVTLILLILHFTFGTIIYLWLVLRFIIVYTFSIIRSAYLNKDVSNEYLILIETLIKNYLSLYKNIIRIPLAVWKTPGNIKFEIENILTREKELFFQNLWLNVLILFFITFSLIMWFFGISSKIWEFLNL
jgi:hypothetical protein